MAGFFDRAVRVYRQEGLLELLRQSLKFTSKFVLLSRLPRKEVEYNGVRVRAGRVLISSDSKPFYESGLIDSMKDHVRKGDDVVIIGGGWGVSTVVSAERVGRSGSVITYEAAKRYAEYVKETAEINDVLGRIQVVHAAVGNVVSIKGVRGSTKNVEPEELQECDVLVMDCEGAELEILENLAIQPHVIIAEPTGF